MLDGFRPSRRPEPTSDPKEKVGGATLVVHSMGKRKRRVETWFRVVEELCGMADVYITPRWSW